MPQAGVLANPGFLVRAAPGFTLPSFRYVQVAASQTIYAGDIVSLSSGYAQQALALPGSNLAVTSSAGATSPLGIACQSITTDASRNYTQPGGIVQSPAYLNIYAFDDVLEIALQLYDGTLTNTPITNLTPFTAYQYGRYRGANASSWQYVITLATTNTPEFRFETTWNQIDIPIGSNYGFGWFKSVASVRAAG